MITSLETAESRRHRLPRPCTCVLSALHARSESIPPSISSQSQLEPAGKHAVLYSLSAIRPTACRCLLHALYHEFHVPATQWEALPPAREVEDNLWPARKWSGVYTVLEPLRAPCKSQNIRWMPAAREKAVRTIVCSRRWVRPQQPSACTRRVCCAHAHGDSEMRTGAARCAQDVSDAVYHVTALAYSLWIRESQCYAIDYMWETYHTCRLLPGAFGTHGVRPRV